MELKLVMCKSSKILKTNINCTCRIENSIFKLGPNIEFNFWLNNAE